MNRRRDFEIARDQGWYRVPAGRASRGVHFEYVAFYFTGAFGDQGWAVHHYARRLGHELSTRRELLPDEADHPRAGEHYYKLQLGPLIRRDPPIVSLRWRRVTFVHTTWDRFEAAEEINELFAEGGEFVDRLFHALRDANLAPERRYPVRESGVDYVVNLAVPCRQGIVVVDVADGAPGSTTPGALRFDHESLGADPHGCLEAIRAEVDRQGGPSPLPQGQDVAQQAGEGRCE
jgi:hypothetical protein